MDPSEVATAVARAARDQQFAEIAALFKPVLRAQVSPAILQAAWTAETDRIGQVTEIGQPTSEPMDDELLRVSVPIRGERGGLTLVMSIDQDGHLNGLQLTTDETWNPPEYADPTTFEEREITIGTGTEAVQGTVSIPNGDGPSGPRLGVVLLSGGGPFDRDGTSGPNKPMKDLAWGLATNGIAVTRFDKLTASQPDLTSRPGFTMTDEYVPHALAAIELLRQESTVERVYLVGHSMGGKVAPRVAAASDSVAGLVILAGDTQPMHHAAVRVARYLSAGDPAAADFVAALTEQAKKVDSPDLSASTPAADLPFGFSGSYWLDLREYDPVATAAALDKPILILQGGRDYQVTVADDLPAWQTGVPHATIHILEADNHLFFPGTAPSTLSDYTTAQHVDPAVIDTITNWLS